MCWTLSHCSGIWWHMSLQILWCSHRAHCVPGLREVAQDLITVNQCKESVWGRRLQCVTATEPPPRQFWNLVHTWRGFKTVPAFSVSFFKHGAILGFQFCLHTKCLVQKCPGAFSAGVASTSLKWRSRKVSFKHHPKDAEKIALD